MLGDSGFTDTNRIVAMYKRHGRQAEMAAEQVSLPQYAIGKWAAARVDIEH